MTAVRTSHDLRTVACGDRRQSFSDRRNIAKYMKRKIFLIYIFLFLMSYNNKLLVANEYNQVFRYEDRKKSIFFENRFMLFIGILPIFIGAFILKKTYPKNTKKKGEWIKFIFSISWTIIVLTIWMGIWYGINLSYYNNISKIYDKIVEIDKKNLWDTAEGIISLKFEQSESGHTKGDIIQINDKTFEIDYYDARPEKVFGYNIPVSKGGILKNNLYVRLKTYKNTIYKIEIKK